MPALKRTAITLLAAAAVAVIIARFSRPLP